MDDFERNKIIKNLSENLFEKKEKKFVIISSGAVGLGRKILKKENNSTQLCATIGQKVLMFNYYKAFCEKGIFSSQILVTKKDLEDKDHLEKIITESFENKIIPIINENDCFSINENAFNNNDILSAEISEIINADLLVLLTNTNGIYDKNKKTVEFIKDKKDVESFLEKEKSFFGSGGVFSKILAGEIVSKKGTKTIIANAREKNVLKKILEGKKTGTIIDLKKQ